MGGAEDPRPETKHKTLSLGEAQDLRHLWLRVGLDIWDFKWGLQLGLIKSAIWNKALLFNIVLTLKDLKPFSVIWLIFHELLPWSNERMLKMFYLSIFLKTIKSLKKIAVATFENGWLAKTCPPKVKVHWPQEN